ncbi:M48 family metalloprotease [Marinibactrum halimedae]|uniref:Peptidase M48 domain-containing protein n=1 Tax=Marinibactrum halimedae TaxID=1444977 RepID=A0AA37WQL6_9GAMM|nr:M48 family metalloprotease [Marinibactrum halimedae]MCD9459966.1 M48 family metalloprotease [Marinibactrum halimedae]GLS28266.1 hypothetical protein GCM10007877_39850 [Marinibactrum halimedae]
MKLFFRQLALNLQLPAILALAALTGGCATNPVTGESQFSLISASQEVAIGRKNYLPSQQSQGGRYVVDPDLNTYINSVGQKLAKVSDRPKLPYEFVVLNNDVPNAWALPGGKIAINRGLLIQLQDEAQLAAVLGHEIVHAAARHGATQQTQSILLGIGTTAASAIGSAYGYGGLAQQGSALGAAAMQAQYGQGQELESDEYGMSYMARAGYEPQAAVELQQLFVKLSAGRQQDRLSTFFASHPPSQKRVEENRKHAAKLAKGVRNKAQFQRAIARIKKDQPAYKAHQQALEYANKKNYAKAISSVKSAIKKQPNESLFHETLGKLQLQQKNQKAALSSFNKAVSLNPEYFSPKLYRGLTQAELKNYTAAERDLLSSTQLLPTQVAVYYLGEVTLAQGKKQDAQQYFQQAQAAGGELGAAAGDKLRSLGVQQ